MEEEIWKTHKSGCEVSSFGRVKGKRVDFLKPSMQYNGYLAVGINRKTIHIHRLVGEAFLGDIPKGMHINHKDGQKTNNFSDNLEIVTPSENALHALAMGLLVPRKGEESALSILKEIEVLEIYELIKRGVSNEEISKKYNVYSGHISSLRHGHRWTELFEKHLKGKEINSTSASKYDFETRTKCVLDLIGGMTNTDLWKKYSKIDRSNFSRIRHREIWKDIWDYIEKNK